MKQNHIDRLNKFYDQKFKKTYEEPMNTYTGKLGYEKFKVPGMFERPEVLKALFIITLICFIISGSINGVYLSKKDTYQSKIEEMKLALKTYTNTDIKKLQVSKDDMDYVDDLLKNYNLTTYEINPDIAAFIQVPFEHPENAIIIYGAEFGWRVLEGDKYPSFHPAFDLVPIFGKFVINPIKITSTVYNAGWNDFAGNYIGLVCSYLGNDWMVTMQHFDTINVAKDQEVIPGQQIGIAGKTGSTAKGINVCIQIAKKTKDGWLPVPLFKENRHRPAPKDVKLIEKYKTKSGETAYNFLID